MVTISDDPAQTGKGQQTAMGRVFNFSAGPATMPVEVLEEAQQHLVDYHGSGMSIMEASHRGKEYSAVHEEAIANIKKLLSLNDDYQVLFLQGGASGQFAMAPMNLVPQGQVANYCSTGSWASKAIKEAKGITSVHIAADTSKEEPARMPRQEEIDLSANAAYLHITSNETIGGTQIKTFPEVDAPLICDMSSDILSRPLDAEKFGLIYAGAQKNLGPAGVTLVILRKELAERAPDTVPTMYRYKTHMDNNSLYNTPPCFSIYMVMLVTRWILKKGGLGVMEKENRDKASVLYDAIDSTGFYRGTADAAFRSDMNVTFRLPSEELEAAFIKEAVSAKFSGLKGHRSVGGIRASIYNAFPAEGVKALADFMAAFESKNG